MRILSSEPSSTVVSVINEVIRLIDKSIRCLVEEPDNANALFNLGDSFLEDIKNGRKAINDSVELTSTERTELLNRLDDANLRRKQALERAKTLWGKPPVTGVFGPA